MDSPAVPTSPELSEPVMRAAGELQDGLDHIIDSPSAAGTLQLIVRRPAVDEREVVDAGELDTDVGLVGDNWSTKPSSGTPDGGPHPEAQLTLMNARVVDLLAAGDRDRWPHAGDQLYVDLDLSGANVPPGTRLQIGEAIVEMTTKPHRGCAKFRARFGAEALRFVNSERGRELELRGRNARVVVPGTIQRGDSVTKLPGT